MIVIVLYKFLIGSIKHTMTQKYTRIIKFVKNKI